MSIKVVLLYLAVVNLLSVAVCCYDKSQARANRYRISEKSLLVLSAIGGSFAMYFTMHIIRHKTRKKKFMIGIPLIIIFQISLIALDLYKF